MRKRIQKSALVAVLIILTIIIADKSISKEAKGHYVKIDTGWKITINDKKYENVALHDFRFNLVNRGDTVILEGNIPDVTIPNPVLTLYTIHADVTVEVNEELLYQYGVVDRINGRLVGYGFHEIPINNYYSGEHIKITLHVSENEAFGSLDSPEIYNGNYLIKDHILRNIIPLAISLFLLVGGICTVIIICSMFGFNPQYRRLIDLALFSIAISLWSICSFDIIILFTYDTRIKVFLEFGAFYLTPIFGLCYFREAVGVSQDKRVSISFRVILGIQILFTCTAYLLQITNIVHFPSLLKVQHVIILIMMLYFIFVYIYRLMKGEKINYSYILGVLVLLIFGLGDVLRFYLQKYTSLMQSDHYRSQLSIGVLIFVVLLVMDYAYEAIHMLYYKARGDVLEHYAYTDFLTDLSNRRFCEDTFEKLQQGNDNYGILIFDLNDLKYVNDELGHREGDCLLQRFSSILKTTFNGYGIVGRMGGDEFIVIFKNMEGIQVEDLLVSMQLLIDKENEKNSIQISTSYGFCTREESKDALVRDVYSIADVRMYQMKEASKKGFRQK